MRDIIEGPPGEDDAPLSWRQRLMWFAGMAVAGSAATALLAYALRALLKL